MLHEHQNQFDSCEISVLEYVSRFHEHIHKEIGAISQAFVVTATMLNQIASIADKYPTKTESHKTC